MSEIRGPRRWNSSVPKFLLEGFDLQRDRGLAQRELLGRLGDALGAGGVDEAAELLEAVLLVAGGRRGHLPISAAGGDGAPDVRPDDSIVPQ